MDKFTIMSSLYGVGGIKKCWPWNHIYTVWKPIASSDGTMDVTRMCSKCLHSWVRKTDVSWQEAREIMKENSGGYENLIRKRVL